MTRTADSPLDAARIELAERVAAAQTAGDWTSADILVPLSDVADMVCRIGDQMHSAHYQAGKANPMVESALRVRWRAMERYGDEHQGGQMADDGEALCAANDQATFVAMAVAPAMWAAAEGRPMWDYDADALLRVARSFMKWAEKVAADAVSCSDSDF